MTSENADTTITDKIEEISKLYIEILTPLIIQIEIQKMVYPVEILNEIRNYASHISKCFFSNISEENKVKNLNNAHDHIVRAIIDCFKILIIYNMELFDKIKKEYPTVDFHDVDNGDFFIKYNEIVHIVNSKLELAKKEESMYDENAINLLKKYEEAFIESIKIDELIEKNRYKIEWTRVKYKKARIKNIIMWVISIVLTCILTNNNQQILQCLIDIFGHLKNILGN